MARSPSTTSTSDCPGARLAQAGLDRAGREVMALADVGGEDQDARGRGLSRRQCR